MLRNVSVFYREVIDEDEEVYELPGGGSLKSLRALITAAHPEVELEEGDVVAFFPPLSGG
jgi:molybdopterin converting factor small subunit